MTGSDSSGSDTWIVLMGLPDVAVVRFQGMLAGEDGLATLRSQGGGPGEHELWSTRAIGPLAGFVAGIAGSQGD